MQCPLRPAWPRDCVREEPTDWQQGLPGMEGEACPVLLMQLNEDWLRALKWSESGHLPRAGGWAEQDAVVVSALEAMRQGVDLAVAELRRRTATQGESE